MRAAVGDDRHPLVVRAEHEVSRVAGGTVGVHEGRAGRDVGARLAAPVRDLAAAARRRGEGMAVAVTVGPLVMGAARHVQVERVVPRAGTSGVAGGAIHGDRELTGRRERDTERIPKPVRPYGIVGSERVVRRDGAVRVVAEHLATHVINVLCAGRVVLVAERDVELAVRSEGDADHPCGSSHFPRGRWR